MGTSGNSACEELRRFSKVLCDRHTASHANLKEKKTVLMMEALWKSNCNFLKGVCMVCVNFVVIVVLEKKFEALISYCSS